MNEARSMQKAVGRGIATPLEFLGLRIRGLTILNPTPAFLYVSQDPNPSRENCIVQVEPFSAVSYPCDYPDRLYIADGELIAPLQSNAKAGVFWSEETAALNVQRTRRNVEYVLSRNADTTMIQFRALAVQATGDNPNPGSNSGAITAQSLQGGTGAQIEAGRAYVLPGFATHRTLYAAMSNPAHTFDEGTRLEGQYGGGVWHTLMELPTGKNFMTVSLTDMALPEIVRLVVTPSQIGAKFDAVIRFDL